MDLTHSDEPRLLLLAIARSNATKQSIVVFGPLGLLAEPVIGRAFARPDGAQ
jgi:hypothetical protein